MKTKKAPKIQDRVEHMTMRQDYIRSALYMLVASGFEINLPVSSLFTKI